MIPNLILNPYRPGGLPNFGYELREQDIKNFELWKAVHLPEDVVKSISMSHKQVVRDAKEKGLKEVCILEEDIMFTAPDSWEQFLAHKPESFDIYLGGAYGLNNAALQRIQREAGKDMIAAEIHNFAGLHCYVISENYYDRFLDTPEDKHIDDQAGRGRFFVCFPFVALQHPGWSSNNRHKEHNDYNADLKREYIYYGKGTNEGQAGY